MEGAGVGWPPVHVEVQRPGFCKGVAVDCVVCDRAAAGRRCDTASNDGAVLHHGISKRTAAAQRLRTPGQIVLVEIVSAELGPETGDIELQRVAGPELQAEVRTVALPLLLE